MIYKWKTYNYKTSAEVAGSVCEELDRTVGLTPENLVDASRPEDAPLHQEFEWNDELAAEEYRKTQARLLISNLSIVIEEQKQESVRAFFSLQHGFHKNSGLYESTITILGPEARETIRNCQKRNGSIQKEVPDAFRTCKRIRSNKFSCK